ncbi:MAG: NUDIX domain-containing protein [Patescibacteria group bacterium]|nr:NUDIX domain-containing protein [Patescibacteria group bacterium]MDE2588148.1 NUDIX domain-containing protein [Patescibacteria group bacterium]
MDGIPTAGVLLIKNGRVLLVKHKEAAGHLNGVYGIPGGRIEVGESVEQAGIRELHEETGLSVKLSDLRPYPNNAYTADIIRKNGERQRFTMTIFYCDTFSGELRAGPETNPVWVDMDKLYLYNLLPNVEKAIEDTREVLGI